MKVELSEQSVEELMQKEMKFLMKVSWDTIKNPHCHPEDREIYMKFYDAAKTVAEFYGAKYDFYDVE